MPPGDLTIHGIKITFDCTKVLGKYIRHNNEKRWAQKKKINKKKGEIN